jgi:hypothetical protein
MKYTAKPVTQNARKAAKPTPLKETTTDTNTKIVNERKIKDGFVYDVTTESGNSSSDANALENVSAPTNDLGKAKGGRQATTTAEKSSYNDWVIDQISSGKQSAQHMADMKYISKDRVGEYAKHAPNTSTSSGDTSSSRTETWEPVMTEAVAPKTQVQTRAHEKRSSNRQWITSNMVNRVAASSQIRRAKRDGLFANGELTDKGRSSLSPEQQKGLSGAYDTKRGRSADQLAHANRTGKYAHGGNTHAGEEFVTEEGKASEHMKAQGGENKSGGAPGGTQVANNAATRVKGTFGDFSSTQAEADLIMAGVNKGTSNGANEAAANAAAEGSEVSTRPQTREEKRSFNKDRRKEASADRKAKRNANKAERVAKRGVNNGTSKGANKAATDVSTPAGPNANKKVKIENTLGEMEAVDRNPEKITLISEKLPEGVFDETGPGMAGDRVDVGTPIAPTQTGPKTKTPLTGYRQSGGPGMTGDGNTKNSPFTMNRLHSSKSPAKMWGPSKVKAGKNGFNRKK